MPPKSKPAALSAFQATSSVTMDHITLFQESLKLAFAQRIEVAEGISPKAKDFFKRIEAIKKIPATAEVDAALEVVYEELHDDEKTLAEVLEIDVKQQDILRRARKAATDNIVGEYKKSHFDQSHSLASELKKCAEKGMSVEDVQKYLDKNFRAVFSLTGHPTNSNSVEYTAVGYAFDEILASTSRANEEDLKRALDAIISTQSYGAKKSPLEEMAETNLALRKIKESEPKIRRDLAAVIAASPYQGLRLPEKLFEVSVWTHGGDADGNPSMTADVLLAGYQSLAEFDATIDIRHDAGDLMKAAAGILAKIGIADFAKKSVEEQEIILAGLLKDPEALAALSNAMPDDKGSAEIVKRLRICGRFPGKTDKLIIANTTGANNALAALLLLKVTGNKVAEPDATIDIVTLSESIEDLKGIHAVQNALLDNETYREHLRHRGRLQQMIAKSDTFRVGGPGAEFWQDVAAGEAYLLGRIARQKYGLDLDVRVFNGGGAALQRGGGKPDEAANRQAKALLYVAWKHNQEHPEDQIAVGELIKGVTTLTIQGHQQQLFCSENVIYNAMEALMSQNLHSAFLAEGLMPSKGDPVSEEVRKEFCEAAIEAYQARYFYDVKDPKESSKGRFINELFANSNRAGVASLNLSSRPAKRPGKDGSKAPDIAPGISFDDLSGDPAAFDLFGTRAITLDRTLAHSGTFAVMFLGLREAFAQKTPREMNEVYKQNKGFRDFIRNQITVLYMVDLDHSWEMMIGEKRPVNVEEIKALAARFEEIETITDPKERQKITMAYLDCYIHDVGKAIYETFTGEIASEELELKTLLQLYSPVLESERRYREREARFGKMVERKAVAEGNDHGDMPISEDGLRIIAATARATDIASNAPVSMSAILSSMEREVKTGRSSESPSPESEKDDLVASSATSSKVKSLLVAGVNPEIPHCLRRYAAALQPQRQSQLTA